MRSYIDGFEGEKQSEVVVTIDGLSGAGKGTLADHISELLDVNHLSTGGVFRRIAREKGMTVLELSKEADRDVDLEVDRRILEKALAEDSVIDSRISSWVLGDYSDLKIYLEADLDERARRVAEREGIPEEEARENIVERDEANRERYRKYYGIDISRRDIYDLVIDNTDLGVEEQRRLVKKVLEKRFPERVG
ncbi:MAG: (d)CMP kinase [Candidatus Nanohaloarchaea archaeon]